MADAPPTGDDETVESENGDPVTDDPVSEDGVTGAEATSETTDPSSVADDGDQFGEDDRSEAELEELVEEKYDFEDFGPADMAEMSPEEWEAAFDEESWITGDRLLDRLEADLSSRVASRDVFAVIERVRYEGQECLLAYSDEGYAMVYPDGGIEGFGTVFRDVKPVVALCSMDSYDPREKPEAEFLLPHPDEVPQGSGEFGNLMLQLAGMAHLLAGVAAIGLALYNITFGIGPELSVFSSTVEIRPETAGTGLSMILGVAGLLFLGIGIFFLFTVANARLSDRFRAEEYRERLRSVGLADGERPDFLPVEARATELGEEERSDADH